MNQCKCGSYAVNHDPKRRLCDCCWRDAKIERLEKQLAALVEAALTPISGSGPAKSMPERRADGLRTEIARMRQALDRIEVLAADSERDAT